MIVKDEERFIEACLDSALASVDEVVVYDTGSTDRTVELARGRGATVLEGHWDDDFARARNEALAACTGTWILWLDADEELAADPDAVRSAAAAAGDADVVRIPIENVGAVGGDFEHVAVRLFRRIHHRWEGSLHEHVVRTDGRGIVRTDAVGVRILHHGYAAEVHESRDKDERNLRIAQAALARATGAERGLALLNVARSHSMCGDLLQAAEHFALARDALDGTDRAFALRLGTEVLIDSGRWTEARMWTDEYAGAGGTPHLVAFLRGSIDLLELGNGYLLAGLDPDAPVTDEFGITIPQPVVRSRIGQALAAEQRHAEAWPLLRDLIDADPVGAPWPAAVLAAHGGGVAMADLVALLPEAHLRDMVGRFIVLDAGARDSFAHALVDRFGEEEPAVVAFAAAHANRLDSVEAMLPWATLVRRSPYDLPCPVIERAKDPAAAPTERFLAAASAHAAFRDPAALQLLFQISELLAPEDEGDAAYILQEIAPDLIVG